MGLHRGDHSSYGRYHQFAILILRPIWHAVDAGQPRGRAETRIVDCPRGKAVKMQKLLKSLIFDESGQDLIEYALIAALVALVAISGLNGLSGKINSEFTKVGNDL